MRMVGGYHVILPACCGQEDQSCPVRASAQSPSRKVGRDYDILGDAIPDQEAPIPRLRQAGTARTLQIHSVPSRIFSL